jgi:hypothetical protein
VINVQTNDASDGKGPPLAIAIARDECRSLVMSLAPETGRRDPTRWHALRMAPIGID